jgi:hypothetical protein
MEVHLYFWDIPKRKVPLAVFKMAIDHLSLKRNSSIKFYKLLGTGKGETFTPSDANPFTWGLLFVSDSPINAIVNSWRRFSSSEKYFKLSAISSHGSWAKKKPFSVEQMSNKNSNVAVITRARIKNRYALKFWKSVPPVVESLKNSDGLLWSIGIGESPIGLQGTFSIWENEAAVSKFAFQGREHAKVIAQTREIGWYAEELFARFEVISKAE